MRLAARAWLVACALGLLPALAQAQVITQKDGRWRGLIGASLALTTGNTVTSAALLNLDVARQTSHTKVSLQGFLNHATSKVAGDTRVTADKWGTAAQYDSDLDMRWFAFGKLRFDGDRLLHLTVRSTLSAGVGYHLVDIEGHSLNVFGGLGYTDTRYSRDQLVNGRMGRALVGPVQRRLEEAGQRAVMGRVLRRHLVGEVIPVPHEALHLADLVRRGTDAQAAGPRIGVIAIAATPAARRQHEAADARRHAGPHGGLPSLIHRSCPFAPRGRHWTRADCKQSCMAATAPGRGGRHPDRAC